MASHCGGGFTCCVLGCFSNSKRDVNLSFYGFPKERICGNAGCTKYRGKISPRALDIGYVACISKEAKKPTWTMFLLLFLWQSPIQDRHRNQGERSFYTGLQHLVKRHRLHSVQQLQAQQKMTSPQQIERFREELKNVLRLKKSLDWNMICPSLNLVWGGWKSQTKICLITLAWPMVSLWRYSNS